MIPVPKEGRLTVRFLAPVDGIHVHCKPHERFACVGAGSCPTNLHHLKTMWKGYAPVFHWREKPFEDWCPAVLEVTERLWDRLNGRILRGEVWTLYRAEGQSGHAEGTGELVDTIAEESLGDAFNMYPTIELVYREKRILWGQEPYLRSRPVVAPVKGERPRAEAIPIEPGPQTPANELNRLLADARRRWNGGPSSNGQPSSNGTH